MLVLLYATVIKFRGFNAARNAFFLIQVTWYKEKMEMHSLISVFLNMTGIWPQPKRFHFLEKVLLQRRD